MSSKIIFIPNKIIGKGLICNKDQTTAFFLSVIINFK